MFDLNGPLLPRKQTLKLARWSRKGKRAWTRLLDWPPPARTAFLLMLVMLLLSVMGCAATSTPPDSLPRNPNPPPSALPDSPPNYLTDAQADISAWRKALQELIAKPAN